MKVSNENATYAAQLSTQRLAFKENLGAKSIRVHNCCCKQKKAFIVGNKWTLKGMLK